MFNFPKIVILKKFVYLSDLLPRYIRYIWNILGYKNVIGMEISKNVTPLRIHILK